MHANVHRPTSSLLFLLVAVCAGCFQERSIPLRAGDLRRIEFCSPPPATTRDWLRAAHAQLADMIPDRPETALLTEELVAADGRPIDVARHFGEPFEVQHTVIGNFYGLMHTAQASHTGDRALHDAIPPWPGFSDTLVRVSDGVTLFGRIGFAERDGRVIRSDCIVLLPGLLGDLRVDRTKQIAAALRANGLHVLAIEVRGSGERAAEQAYTFGVRETGDLLAVAEWLQAMPEVRRTGLIGFCWGANQALLAAWADGCGPSHAAISPRIAGELRPANPAVRHFEAGVIAFSPCLEFENIIERCDHEYATLENPVLASLQGGIRARKNTRAYPDRNGSLRTLIDYEFADWNQRVPGVVALGLDYLRFVDFRGKPAGDKLEAARIPTLIVHGRNDPLADAQEVADFIATVENPGVAAIVLPGGGHVGFAPFARAYFYSLILGFFDPTTGAAAGTAADE